jgi:hypothetical protein
VGLFRRRRADAELTAAREAFRRCAAELDSAQRALLSAVPTARAKGIPLDEAIDGYLAGLDRLEAQMPGWRIEQTEDAWKDCFRVLAESRAEVLRVKEKPPKGFEALNAKLGDVIAPLEQFAYAALTLTRRRDS